MLLAEDLLTDERIAAHPDVQVTDRTLRNWKRHPEFQARISQLIDELQERARQKGLGRLDRRKAAAEDRHRRMTALFEARAEAGGRGIGADTGMIVKSFKVVGGGEEAYTVEEWSFDHQLMRELRELEKQVAQDTGDWSEKRELSGPGGESLVIQLIEREDGPA